VCSSDLITRKWLKEKKENISGFYFGIGENLKIKDQLKFFGHLEEERFAVLAASQVFCFPTLWKMEGLPLALIEAMMMKKPIIASSVGGVPEAVYDNKNGILIKPGDVDDLVNAIETLYKDKEMRERLGTRGREYGEKTFNAAKMVEETKEVFEKVLEKK